MKWSSRLLVLVCTLLALPATVAAQEIHEEGLSIARRVDVSEYNDVYGLDIDPETGDLYFIADRGTDIYVLHSDDTIEEVILDAGSWTGGLSDLRIGPDGLLYAITSNGALLGHVQRFTFDGEVLEDLAVLESSSGNAWALDFDCADILFASNYNPQLWRVTPDGDVTSFTPDFTWTDVDELHTGHDNFLYVQDGTSRDSDSDKVFLVDPHGAVTTYVTGLPESYCGAYDWSAGDYLYAGFHSGQVFRLHDENGNGAID